MARVRVKFTYPSDKIATPIIHRVSMDYRLVSDIRRADVTEGVGWVILQLEGNQSDIDAGIQWVTSQGVRVDPVEGDVIQ